MYLFKRFCFIIIVLMSVIFLNSLLKAESELDDEEILVVKDTIPLNNYKAIRYYKYRKFNRDVFLGVVYSIYQGNKEVAQIYDARLELSSICALMRPVSAGHNQTPDSNLIGKIVSERDTTKPHSCYFGDINGDNIDEIVLEGYSMGAHCCSSTWIYGLGDSLKLLLYIDACEFDDAFIDLNNDSIPEILTWDNQWTSWRDENARYQYTIFLPPVIWSWDKNRYRVANIKFADYLIKHYNLDRNRGIYTNPENSPFPPFSCDEYDLWDFVIKNYYAGRADLADSLFNACWPAQDTMKLIIYQQFQHRLRVSKYWPQVLESKW